MNPALLLPALAMGLLGSTHCAVMCGGVVAMSCSALPLSRRASARAQFPYLLAYSGGRISSYATAGALAGAMGATLASFGHLGQAQAALRLVAGLMMLSVGLYIAGLARWFARIERIGEPVWRRIAPLARALVPVKSPVSALALGALWGWLPCGLVYAALAGAVTSGSAVGGAATMAAFGAGTLPALLAMGSASAVLARAARRPWVRAGAGALLLAFGVVQVTYAGRAFVAARSSGVPTCCAPHHALASADAAPQIR